MPYLKPGNFVIFQKAEAICPYSPPNRFASSVSVPNSPAIMRSKGGDLVLTSALAGRVTALARDLERPCITAGSFAVDLGAPGRPCITHQNRWVSRHHVIF